MATTLQTFMKRFKRLFIKHPQKVSALIDKTTQTAHTQDDMAFKAGAAVTFITPIGAYAGASGEQKMRAMAEQQFFVMSASGNTTIN